MEAMAGVAAVRGGSLPMPSPSQSARKEWRAVSEHSVRSASNEFFNLLVKTEKIVEQDLERSKLGQTDERTIYEVQQGTGPLNVEFCSIVMDGSLDNDLLQQRLHSISRQREELQHMEVELRAQVIARSGMMALQNSFDVQIKDQANAAAKLKEQLHEMEHTIHELELEMEEKDRELRAVKIDNEAAWAKEDLLREQNKELASFRREHDNSEAERGQNLKQIQDLKEHIQEKERQFLELEEQHRVAHETVLLKDEQLREAQTWIARVQEMDALQSSTNHSLQAELRDRVEQFNQFWLGCQRQFADMERHHLQTIQQLQLELAETRERSGVYTDESSLTRANSKEESAFSHSSGIQFNLNEVGTGNTGVLPNGNVEDVVPFTSATTDTSTKSDQIPGVSIVPSSMYGVGAYGPPGQVTALHPFVMHQQGVQPSLPSANMHVSPSHVGHFQLMPAMSPHPDWQNQVVSDGSQIPNQNQYQLSQSEQNLLESRAHYEYELSVNGHILQQDHLDVNISPSQEAGSVNTTPSEESQVFLSNDRNDLVAEQFQPSFQGSSQFSEAFILDSPEDNLETKVPNETVVFAANHSLEEPNLTTEQPSVTDISAHPVNSCETMKSIPSVTVSSDSSSSIERSTNLLAARKVPEPSLLDERSLLSCIVRAIPAGSGGQIRISSTLSNRLGKMLAPLHWHDYRKKYGKLDEFVSGHPKLFVVDGDFIHLRDGAQEIISATAAVAKVAAAAAASAPYASSLASVAVTPMAQSHHRLKKVPFINSKSSKAGSTEHLVAVTPEEVGNKPTQHSVVQNQHSNGVSYNIVNGLSNVRILSKPKDLQELNGVRSEIRPDQSSIHMNVGNGANPDRAGLSIPQGKGPINGKYGNIIAGKQHGRVTGAALTSRR